MARKRTKHKSTSFVARAFCVAVLSCTVVAGVGFGFASAGGGTNQDATVFGITTLSSSSKSAQTSTSTTAFDTKAARNTSLATSSSRDISASIEEIEAEKEAQRQAEEEARLREEQAHISAAETAKAEWSSTASSESASAAALRLSDVDWSVGKDAFVEEWAVRIDTYLSGTALAGYGQTFAEAAWEYGVDPRFSPAISNTESGNGAHCFASCNAWGWGKTGWSDWDTAIYAHVKGLAEGYGYSLTYSGASKYCPPNTEFWFNNTLNNMLSI